jgi:hypothetical protein
MLYPGLSSNRAPCAVGYRPYRFGVPERLATPRPEIECPCTSMNLTEIRRDAEHRWAFVGLRGGQAG